MGRIPRRPLRQRGATATPPIDTFIDTFAAGYLTPSAVGGEIVNRVTEYPRSPKPGHDQRPPNLKDR
jgi:hypothetical protein